MTPDVCNHLRHADAALTRARSMADGRDAMVGAGLTDAQIGRAVDRLLLVAIEEIQAATRALNEARS